MERVGDDGEDGEGVDEADHDQGVCVVHLQSIINKEVVGSFELEEERTSLKLGYSKSLERMSLAP